MNSDVELIYSVCPGETINIETKTIVIHNSYYAALSRWWYSESRTRLVEWIQNVINSETKKMRRENIEKMIHGIRNLAYTYAGSNIAKSLMDQVKFLEELSRELNREINIKPDKGARGKNILKDFQRDIRYDIIKHSV